RPRLRRLLASCEGGEQIVAAFDKALGLAPGFRARSHEAPLAAPGLAAPVPRRRHPQADRGERRGVGAKDARAERYGLRLRQGANRVSLLVGEAALRADQDRRRAGRRHERLAAALVGEVERAIRGPL